MLTSHVIVSVPQNMSNEEFVRYQKLFGISMGVFAYVLLYMLVIRRAYNTDKSS